MQSERHLLALICVKDQRCVNVIQTHLDFSKIEQTNDNLPASYVFAFTYVCNFLLDLLNHFVDTGKHSKQQLDSMTNIDFP